MNNGHFKGCSNTSTGCWCEMKRGWVLLGIAGVILIAEIVGGKVSHSLALLADAGHVFVDICAILLNVFVAYRVKRGANEARTRKVGGYISAILLGGVAIWVLVKAIERFQEPREVVSVWMISVAIFGAIGNFVQYRIVKSAKEDHVTNKSMRLQILSDFIQSIVIMFGGAFIWMTNWVLIDPITSMGIAIWMGILTCILLKDLRSGKYSGHHHH